MPGGVAFRSNIIMCDPTKKHAGNPANETGKRVVEVAQEVNRSIEKAREQEEKLGCTGGFELGGRRK